MRECRKCKCDLSNVGYHGEKVKNFWGVYKWRYWCKKHWYEKFVEEISSHPILLAKYYEIYGKHPKEVLKIK